MRQFDVYDAPSETSRRIAPYVVVVQSHFLDGLPTVVVAPLLRGQDRLAYTEVSVRIQFSDQDLLLSLAELVVVEGRSLTRLRGDVRFHEDAIRRALDRVFTGF